jgi:hypothetical protein
LPFSPVHAEPNPNLLTQQRTRGCPISHDVLCREMWETRTPTCSPRNSHCSKATTRAIKNLSKSLPCPIRKPSPLRHGYRITRRPLYLHPPTLDNRKPTRTWKPDFIKNPAPTRNPKQQTSILHRSTRMFGAHRKYLLMTILRVAHGKQISIGSQLKLISPGSNTMPAHAECKRDTNRHRNAALCLQLTCERSN